MIPDVAVSRVTEAAGAAQPMDAAAPQVAVQVLPGSGSRVGRPRARAGQAGARPAGETGPVSPPTRQPQPGNGDNHNHGNNHNW